MPTKSNSKKLTASTSPPPRLKQPSQREPWTPWGKWSKRRREEQERRRIEREERQRQKQRAKEVRRLRRRRVTLRSSVFLGLMVLACFIGFLVLLLLGRPYPWEAFSDVTSAMTLSEELENKQQRWNELGINHYTVEVTYSSGATRCGPTTLEVRNKQIIGNTARQAEQWTQQEVCSKVLTDITIEGAFEWIDRELLALQPGEMYLRASFDPIIGYPTLLKGGDYHLLAAGTADCCWQAEWKSLQPID
jgi:hypothetical protein